MNQKVYNFDIIIKLMKNTDDETMLAIRQSFLEQEKELQKLKQILSDKEGIILLMLNNYIDNIM